MSGALLLVPFLLLRFALPALAGGGALRRAARFAPLRGAERYAYALYQLSTAGVLLCPFFCAVRTGPAAWCAAGAALYGIGLVLCAAALWNFSSPGASGLAVGGVYRFSRNPMYLAYFLLFLGIALLTQSPVQIAFTLTLQLSGHWIILSEERWCAETFGAAYEDYRRRVRRYL